MNKTVSLTDYAKSAMEQGKKLKELANLFAETLAEINSDNEELASDVEIQLNSLFSGDVQYNPNAFNAFLDKSSADVSVNVTVHVLIERWELDSGESGLNILGRGSFDEILVHMGETVSGLEASEDAWKVTWRDGKEIHLTDCHDNKTFLSVESLEVPVEKSEG